MNGPPKLTPEQQAFIREKLKMIHAFLKEQGILPEQVVAYTQLLDLEEFCEEFNRLDGIGDPEDPRMTPASALESLLSADALDIQQDVLDTLPTFVDGFDRFHSEYRPEADHG